MPELPEVETVRRTIEPHVVGRRVLRLEVREPRLRRPVPSDIAARLEGRTIAAVARRGKYLLIDVGEGLWWVVHLGMSGRLCVGEPPPGLGHVHVVAELEDGGRLYFRDPRRFGLMTLVSEPAELGAIGVEPLGAEFSGELLAALARRHGRLAVKSLLMDQRLIAGVGNIYANEALFLAGVRPGRRSARVSRADWARIADAVRAVLTRAIESRGSSLLDYRDAEGNAGEFQRSLLVYERAGEPCRTCGELVKRRTLGGRGTFFCARCQR